MTLSGTGGEGRVAVEAACPVFPVAIAKEREGEQ